MSIRRLLSTALFILAFSVSISGTFASPADACDPMGDTGHC